MQKSSQTLSWCDVMNICREASSNLKAAMRRCTSWHWAIRITKQRKFSCNKQSLMPHRDVEMGYTLHCKLSRSLLGEPGLLESNASCPFASYLVNCLLKFIFF